MDGILCSRGYKRSMSGSHQPAPIPTYLIGTGELPKVNELERLPANSPASLFKSVSRGTSICFNVPLKSLL